MTRKMTRTVFAFALAVAMIGAFSSSGHAALSTAERPAAAAPSEQTTLAAAPATFATDAPAATTAAPAAPVAEPRKTVATKVKPQPQRLAFSPRKGYPCH